jgi:hypothetical protein
VLFVASLGFVAIGILRARITPRWRQLGEPTANLLRRGLSWPALTLAAALAVFNAYNTGSQVHCIVFSDEFLPQHMVWHSVYLGMEVHQAFWKTYGKEFVNDKGELQMGDGPLPPQANSCEKIYGIPDS